MNARLSWLKDLFVVPTISFRLPYGLVVLRHDRRRLVSFGVASHPTAEWLAQQVTEAFPWDEAPRYLLRDRDGAYGQVFKRRLPAMGIRDRPIARRSPWQNGHVERFISSIRRECVDHFIVFGERLLSRILSAYSAYYNQVRTHLSLDKDAAVFRTVQRRGRITARPVLAGCTTTTLEVEFSVGTGMWTILGSARRWVATAEGRCSG